MDLQNDHGAFPQTCGRKIIEMNSGRKIIEMNSTEKEYLLLV